MYPSFKTVLGVLLMIACSQGDSAPQSSAVEETDYEAPSYPWMETVSENQLLLHRISPPEGFYRVDLEPGTFAHWLRGIPVKPGHPPVHDYNGNPLAYQRGHVAVLDLDLSNRDLQQCADAIIRLRAEYLWSKGRGLETAFHFTNGDLATFRAWGNGMRPVVSGSSVVWRESGRPDSSYNSYRAYLETMFMYASTLSLQGELQKIHHRQARPGDVIIQGGSPGHGVLILDMAEDANGKKVILLAQSYMPAQEMHVLKNLADPDRGAWFPLDFTHVLQTPLWLFNANDFYRFGE